MKKHTLLRSIGAMIAIGIVALSTGVFAHDGHGRGRDGAEMIERLANKLNLSADQKARIKSYQDQFNTTNASTLQQIQTLRDQMRQKFDDNDKDGAKATREQLMAKEQSLQGARQNLMAQIKGVLTADQQAQLEKMQANHPGGKGGHCNHDGNGQRPEKGQQNHPAPGTQQQGTIH